MNQDRFIKCSDSFFVDADYQFALQKRGISSIDDVFAFEGGENLTKENLAQFRSRIQFQVDDPKARLFLKRYNKPPAIVQIKNWLSARGKKSCAWFDYQVPEKLASLGIGTAKVICYGEQFGTLFEKRSFCITEEIPYAKSLEQRLPACFYSTDKSIEQRRGFIKELALFIQKFHQAGFCHRDLYLCHIFYSDKSKFYLIDLARTFKPFVLKRRYRIKDIAQLYYSAPGKFFTKTDRLRFYYYLTGCKKMKKADKRFILRIKKKAERMAKHDRKHGRTAPLVSAKAEL